eukprot:2831293-Rhodomonas_salina.1
MMMMTPARGSEGRAVAGMSCGGQTGRLMTEADSLRLRVQTQARRGLANSVEAAETRLSRRLERSCRTLP